MLSSSGARISCAKMLKHPRRVQVFKVDLCPLSSIAIVSFRIEMKRMVRIKGEERKDTAFSHLISSWQFSCFQLMYQSRIEIMTRCLFKHGMFHFDSHSASDNDHDLFIDNICCVGVAD